MIRLADIELPADTAKQLAAWQAAIDAIPGYPQRVEAARRQFAQCNDGRRPAFREVRRHLDALCFGERRCMYCEDSCADEVEHVRPKALFPEHVFAWRNYIYACGPCNGIKRDNFPRLVAGAVQNLARGPRDPVEPPPAGTDLLIDPRAEDPAEFLVLDLETGFVLPRPSLAAMPKHRADQTIAVLKPNRPLLIKARRQSLTNYVARLSEYIQLRDADACAEAEAYGASLRTMGHPMVWNELRRHHAKYPRLKRLFTCAPEALTWEPRAQGLGD